MDFTQLRQSIRKDVQPEVVATVDHIIVGVNEHTNSLINEEQKTLIVSENVIKTREIISIGPSTNRSPSFSEMEGHHYSVFYKDLKFRKFGGRSKPCQLLAGETFYTFPALQDKRDVISEETTESLNKHLHQGQLKRIRLTEGGFELDLQNNTILKTTALSWGRSLPEFIDLVENKDQLPKELIESIPHFSGPGKLYISLEISDQTDELLKKTFFLPLSYTHDHGHFIGEFFQAENNQMNGEFLFFLNLENLSEEEVSRTIRTFKRVLEKAFPELLSKIKNEYIHLDLSSSSIDPLLHTTSSLNEILPENLKLSFV